MMKRYTWTPELIGKLRNDVDTLVKTGKARNKGHAFEVLSSKWKLKPLTVENVYYEKGGLNKNRVTKKSNLIGSTSMTIDQAISFWYDMKRWGITVN